MTGPEVIERVARAIREEVVRQYRDDERRHCPAGRWFYEEHIAPMQIALSALAAIREPSEAMIKVCDDERGLPRAMSAVVTWHAMHAALARELGIDDA